MKFKVVWSNPPKYFVDGKEVSKKKFDKVCRTKWLGSVPKPTTLMQTSKSWPRTSDAIGCHPSQKAETEAALKKLGVPTEINAQGEAIVRDNAHQRDLCKALKIVNHRGGYGQITG